MRPSPAPGRVSSGASSHPEARRHAITVGLIVITVIATACAGGDRDLDDSRPAQRRSPDALADGFVTRTEYGAAVELARACVEELGYPTTPVQTLLDGFRMDFGVDPGGRLERDMWQAWDRCRAIHSYEVEVAYFAQLVRPSVETAALARELASSLGRAGVEGVNAAMDDGTIASVIVAQDGGPEAWACRERYLIQTGAARPRPPAPASTASP